jgi:hypothetical protein
MKKAPLQAHAAAPLGIFDPFNSPCVGAMGERLRISTTAALAARAILPA